MTSVSVAMATYNGEQYIRRQLDSLVTQRQIPSELVISDDKSADNTIPIISTFAKTAPFPVRVYQNETRIGYRKNFMRAAGLCRSELISFCDQDDFWYPDKITSCAKPFVDRDVLLTYHNADVVTHDGKKIGELITHPKEGAVLTPLSSGPWLFGLGLTQMFRRSLLQFSDFWEQSLDQNSDGQPLAHDQWFFFLASVFGSIVYLREPLVAYTQHGSNVYGWHKPTIRDQVEKYFLNHGDRFSYIARATDIRAEILDNAKKPLEEVWAKRAATASELYRRFSVYYGAKATLYTSVDLSSRLRAFFKLLITGGYAGGGWTLGRRSLVPDLCLGLPLGPFLPSASKHTHQRPPVEAQQ